MWLMEIETRNYLSYELLFCLMYINSKRNPDIIVSVWGFNVKSIFFFNLIIDAYVPFVFLGLSLITGGDIVCDIMGIISGHIYYFVKDIIPLQYKYDLLITPEFMYFYF